MLPTVTVGVRTVESSMKAITEEVAGTVRAARRATLEAKLSGRITELPVVAGQRVREGERMARIEAGEAVARSDQANATLEQAERDWRRLSALFEQAALTRAEYEAADTRLRMARASVAEAKSILEHAEVVAPFDGVVARKWVDVGDQAAPGRPLITVEDPSSLELEADLPEGIASHVRQGDELAVRVDGVVGDITGTVREIAPAADPVTRTIRIKLELPLEEGLRSGQFARLQVPTGEGESLSVPASAVVRRGQMEIVFVVVNRRAELRLVKTGGVNGESVEILAGLEAGETVVIEGAGQLADGQPVEVK
jgi:RND family efflux transporter MFP subunit